MRRAVVAGNAKMNLTRSACASLLRELQEDLKARPAGCDVVFCPPFTLLGVAETELADSAIGYGAQDVHWEASGAFTGEISPAMLREAGCTYGIVGHSERRKYFAETDAWVQRKTTALLEARLIPIVCIGETESERESGATEVVLSRQIVGSLTGVPVQDPSRILVAYEPVWAIGTGRTATPAQAEEAHRHVRSELGRILGETVSRAVRILYGGSVTPDNASELMGCENVDGALVGGASLKASTFLPIVRAAGA